MKRFPAITVALDLGEADLVPVIAEAVGPFAVHPVDGVRPEFPRLPQYWVVTHVRTGLRLPGFYESRIDALGAAMQIQGTVDFDDVVDLVVAAPDVAGLVALIDGVWPTLAEIITRWGDDLVEPSPTTADDALAHRDQITACLERRSIRA